MDASIALRLPCPRSSPRTPARSRRIATARGTSSEAPSCERRTSSRARLFRDVDPSGSARARAFTAASSASFVAPSHAPAVSRKAKAEGLFSTTAMRPDFASARRMRSETKTRAARSRARAPSNVASFRRTSARRSVTGSPEPAVSPPAIACSAMPIPSRLKPVTTPSVPEKPTERYGIFPSGRTTETSFWRSKMSPPSKSKFRARRTPPSGVLARKPVHADASAGASTNRCETSCSA